MWEWVCVWDVGAWVSEFWTNGIVYMHEYSELNSIWATGGLSEF